MNRILSRLGLRPDPDFQRKQAVEDVVIQARLDYLKWLIERASDHEERDA